MRRILLLALLAPALPTAMLASSTDFNVVNPPRRADPMVLPTAGLASTTDFNVIDPPRRADPMAIHMAAVVANSISFNSRTSQTPRVAVPEPSAFEMLGAGLIGLAGIARRKLFERKS